MLTSGKYIVRLRRVVSGLVALWLLKAVPGLSQDVPPPVFRSGVDLVTVDVTVLDRAGTPLTTLTADDFSITVDGRPRRILSHRLVGSAGSDEGRGTNQPSPLSVPDTPRLIVVVVDRPAPACRAGSAPAERGGQVPHEPATH